MSWQEEQRANRAAKAEQARLDQAARTGDQIALMRASGEQARADREAAATLEAEKADKRREAWDRRKESLRALAGAVWAFTAAHVVDVLIYAIAAVSFAMAAPSMSDYGAAVYASPRGGLLPLITELGMWAFAVAVLVSRRRTPTRPVFGLQAGVWVFGALAFGANALHGLDRGFGPASIMGVVSVAGVVAHQLAIATPPRSRIERRATRIERLAAGKAAAATRAAVRAATAQIDADGHARLTYAAGTYRLNWRRQLVPAVPDLDVPGPPDALDAEIAALLRNPARPESDPRPELESGGGVATASDPSPESRPGPTRDGGGVTSGEAEPDPSTPRRTARTKRDARSRPAVTTGRDARWERLRNRLAEAVVAGDIDPETASIYAIAKTLRCGKPAAKRLREELHNTDQD
ncbi:hypothetical protein ACQPXB_40715 [Amycolatopsis sp. CA-161197]|uniref:hypothetical protein n=1 Tax=Amycolatopsis sp. CA-161197 TaxID=3239922 RepID=UPI003D8C1BFC